MSERRFLVAPSDLEEGRATIRGGEHHHLFKVLRLGPGDEVSVFDGAGRGFRGALESVDGTRAVVKLAGPLDGRIEPALRVTLMAGILHGERMDWAVEKATEIGVARFLPVTSERGMVKPRTGGWGKPERWRRIALSAAKQSGRLSLPEIPEPVPFDEALRLSGAGPAMRLIFHPGATPLLGEARAATGEAHLLVGPEGGWSDGEVLRARAAGFAPAGLGPLTLRAETAVAAAAALVLLSGRASF